jgi:PAS domain S-box-containing protein
MTSSSIPSSLAGDGDRLRLFVAGVTDYAIYALSPDGTVNSWNAGAQRFKGYAADEIIGQHFSRFYTAEDRARQLPERALWIAESEGKFEDEGWRVRQDGTRFWASVVLDAIRDEQGVLIGFTKITRDITDRKQAAEAQHASEEQFRLLVQGVTDYAIYLLAPDGAISNWNAGAQRIKGYAAAEVIGSHFSRFYIPEDVARGLPMLALATALREGRFESEGWRVRKDGSRFWAHVVIDPIRSQMGDLVGFAKVTRDISERRKAAEDLEAATAALFHSQKLEAIGKLTGGVAHDFNNLLSVIVNGLGILQRSLRAPDDARVLEAMGRAVARGATLTQQLLSFARQQPLKQDDVGLNAVILAFEEVMRRAPKAALAFKLALAPTLPLVRIDVAQFESALLNLIVNASDATPDGGSILLATDVVDIDADLAGGLVAGRYVRVRVTDTGSGMSREIAAKAIDPFFTTKPMGQGTGLGLSQAYGLAQQSHGDLTIDSAEAQGTTVSLYFPALAGAGAGVASDGQDAAGPVRERALVVDDQPDVLEMAVALFGTLGYEVLSATNGVDALALIAQTPQIDVLFSDVVMPGMNGIELAKAAHARAPAMRIILASGYTTAALTSQTVADHFSFINKPYTMAQILKQLRS